MTARESQRRTGPAGFARSGLRMASSFARMRARRGDEARRSRAQKRRKNLPGLAWPSLDRPVVARGQSAPTIVRSASGREWERGEGRGLTRAGGPATVTMASFCVAARPLSSLWFFFFFRWWCRRTRLRYQCMRPWLLTAVALGRISRCWGVASTSQARVADQPSPDPSSRRGLHILR